MFPQMSRFPLNEASLVISILLAFNVPVKLGLLLGAFEPNDVIIVVEKLASLPRASASSFNVSRVAGALETRLATAVLTNAVVASCSELLLEAAVGAVGVPVNVGDTRFAFKFNEAST